MASLSILWGASYALFGEYLAAAIPSGYAVASFISTAVFSVHKRFALFRFSQLLMSLFLPFLLMVQLGGIVQSSAVVMWSLTCPLGALVFAERRQAIGWFIAYVGLVMTAVLIERLPLPGNSLPPEAIILFFSMNICGVSVVAFVLLHYFAGEKNLALEILDRQRDWIRRAFSSYISPNLVRHLIDHPEELRLGGKRRECSFVLTDLADFTGLVERTDPAVIVGVLNAYLEGMSRIAFDHGGTVEKVVSDSVAIMFSAPVVQPDHADRAVACALAMDAFCQEFAAAKRAEGIPLGITRIGVNTGPVIVGNVGSESHLDYRALGDAINIASRLEGASKTLGTRVLASANTIDRCERIQGRPAGRLRVKGKSEPVETYEPVADAAARSAEIEEYRKAFDLLVKGDNTAETAFRALVDADPVDALSAFFLARLRRNEPGIEIKITEK